MLFMRTFLLLLFSFSMSVLRAGGTVGGKVTGPDQQPAEFAIVTLLNASDSSLVKGAVTTADGSFLLEDLPAGKFLLTITMTGYAKKWQGPFELSENQQLQLPELSLEVTKEMETVTIASAQPLFVQKPGMLVMNVENSP